MEQLLHTFDINSTDAQMMIVWAFLFVVLWKSLAKGVFTRLLTLVEAREAAVFGSSERAKAAREEAAELSSSIEERLSVSRAEAMKGKNEKLSLSRANAQSLVDAAATAAEASLVSERKAIKSWIESATGALESDCGEMAEQVVSQVRSKVLLQ